MNLASRLFPVGGLSMIMAGALLLVAFASRAAFFDGGERPTTTYEKFLPLAVAGDPAIQYFIGYMFFFGEGVELDYDEAHYWLHQSAEEGDSGAQRDLGVFHSRALSRVPEKFYDAFEANLWFSLAASNPQNPEASPTAARYLKFFLFAAGKGLAAVKAGQYPGKSIYHGLCAGCHGFDGQAAYPQASSFAPGQGLDKDDPYLLDKLTRHLGSNAVQENTLSIKAARKVLEFLSSLQETASDGQASGVAGVDEPFDPHLLLGEQVYLRFCGGCHGFNGIAWYVNSPSFALRERMHKSDAELQQSIENGRGAMPSWEYMLRPDQIGALLRYIRTLARSYENGIMGELRRPEQYLRFRPQGEVGGSWSGDDFR